MEEFNPEFKVGYAKGDMTPPIGLNIPGYFKIRVSEGIINHLLIHAIAFENGGERAIFFACDALSVFNDAYKNISQTINDEFGIPQENIFIHATHTHTSARIHSVPERKDDNLLSHAYYARLHRTFCDLARFALEDLKPAKMSIGRGEAKGVGFMRRYEMKNGTYVTNPAWGNPNILRPDGTQDHSLQLVRIQREGAKELLLINFGTHPDTLGGKRFFTDWPGYVVEYVNRAFEGEVNAVMINGCQGNSNHWNKMKPQDVPNKGIDKAKRMARIIAGEVLKVYDSCEGIKEGIVKGFKETALVGKNPCDPEEIPLAKMVNQKYKELKDSNHPELLAIRAETKMSVPKANRIVANLSNPDTFQIDLFGLQIGNLAFIGFSGEPFCEIGLGVKSRSKMDMTICSCCTNGSNGYFPTKEALSVEGGYESATCKYAHDIATILEDTACKIIDQMERI